MVGARHAISIDMDASGDDIFENSSAIGSKYLHSRTQDFFSPSSSYGRQPEVLLF